MEGGGTIGLSTASRRSQISSWMMFSTVTVASPCARHGRVSARNAAQLSSRAHCASGCREGAPTG